jgi:hypothetical protein
MINKKKLRAEIEELFKDLIFDEVNHKYYLATQPDLELTSATSIVKRYENFDRDYWSKKKADEYNMTQEEVIKEWDKKSKIATEKGSLVHKYLENKSLNLPVKGIDIKEYRSTLISLYRHLAGRYKIICSELRMYDPDLRVSGTCDVLAYNLETNRLALLDYKTGKPILRDTYIDKKTGKEKKTNFKLRPPFDYLPNTNHSRYSIQLSIYRHILTKVGYEVDELKLIHIDRDRFTIVDADKIDVSVIWK